MLNHDEINKKIEHIYCELHILKLLSTYSDNKRIMALIDEIRSDIDGLVLILFDRISDSYETSIENLILLTKEKMQYAAMEALRFLSEKGYDLNGDIYLLFYSLPAIFRIQASAGKTEKEIYRILYDFIERYKS